MPHIFIHLSDIHFGQEKGGLVIVNNDIKDSLIKDAQHFISGMPDRSANGIIISGDIAYAGKESEYTEAGLWLDRLTAAVGCNRFAVQVVPGNHDIDRSKISNAAQLLTDEIAKNGDAALDKFLANEADREILYNKFAAYRVFAEAYDCPLDNDGNVLNHKIIEIAPNKWLKFYLVNTALTCSKTQNEEGNLLLGQRQRVISSLPNVEIVVIAHHPLNWLQDSEDALRYIKNRARVFISGHEHFPEHKLDTVKEDIQLLSIASGAAVPPTATATHNYHYNIIEFGWDDDRCCLCVNIFPRVWNDDEKEFKEDGTFKKEDCCFTLKCPNFEISKKNGNLAEEIKEETEKPEPLPIFTQNIHKDEAMSEDREQMLLLRFFRELSSRQRLAVLIEMNALPSDLTEPVTHTIETKAVRSLLSSGKTEELDQSINQILSTKI